MSVVDIEDKMEALHQALRKLADAEIAGGAPVFMEWPDRWYEGARWRCTTGHVSMMTLKTDEGSRCLACFCAVHITFPEDSDGPIPIASKVP